MTLSGTNVFQKKHSQPFSIVRVDVSDYLTGMYILQLSMNGEVIHRKILIQ